MPPYSEIDRIRECIASVDEGECGTGCQATNSQSKVHPYFAVIKPGIATCMINGVSDVGDTILDPFCGSGTVGVEGSILDRNVICSDINPLATLVTKVKLSPISNDEVRRKVGEIARIFHSDRESDTTRPVPYVKNLDHWFSPESARDLARLKHAVESVRDTSSVDFLAVAFSNTVKKASKSINGFDIEYRLPKNGKIKPSVDVIETFKTMPR